MREPTGRQAEISKVEWKVSRQAGKHTDGKQADRWSYNGTRTRGAKRQASSIKHEGCNKHRMLGS